MFLHADSKGSDQTGRAESSLGAQVILLVLLCGGSNELATSKNTFRIFPTKINLHVLMFIMQGHKVTPS